MKPTERKRRREKFLAGLSWVKILDKPLGCDGIKWGTVMMMDLYEHGPQDNRQPARGIQDKSHCKKAGRYRLTAREGGEWANTAMSGNYCWSHLIQQINIAHEWPRWAKAMEQFSKDNPLEES